MDKNSNMLQHIMAGIFVFGLIMSIMIPVVGSVTNDEMTELERITTGGGDPTPPSGWTPGN